MRADTPLFLLFAVALAACGQPFESNPVDGPPAAPNAAEPAVPPPAAGVTAADGASDPVASAEGDRDVVPATRTRPMQGDWVQELPDRSVRPSPLHPRDAMVVARDALAAFKLRNAQPTVLLAGFDHHGTPIAATSPDPADVPPGTPHLVLDLEATRGPVQHWFFCKETIDRCARESGTLTGCVEFASACTTVEPWDEGEECCPRQCLNDYDTRLAEGLSPEAAWFDTFEVDVPTCHPPIIAIAQEAAAANAAVLAATPNGVEEVSQ